MAQRSESKFFLSDTVSPFSKRRVNLHPNRCIPSILNREREENKRETEIKKNVSKTKCLLHYMMQEYQGHFQESVSNLYIIIKIQNKISYFHFEKAVICLTIMTLKLK